MSILNFIINNLEKSVKGYDGNNGNKVCYKYNDKFYMLKYPYLLDDCDDRYQNNIYCEYISSKIFELLGMDVQKVFIAKCDKVNKDELCVACEDFTFYDINNNYKLENFAEQKNTHVESKSKGYNSDLNEILNILEKYPIEKKEVFINSFWKMFVIDAFIGNRDRHNGNWGFLCNYKTNDIKFAPIYDCEDSLITSISKDFLNEIEKNNYEYLNNFIDSSTSAIHINGKSINYKDFLCSYDDENLYKAIKEVVPKINLEKINKIIDDTDGLNSRIKILYKNILKMRKERLLDIPYEKLIKQDKKYGVNEIKDKVNEDVKVNNIEIKQQINKKEKTY